MSDTVFFPLAGTPTAREIAGWIDGTIRPGDEGTRRVTGVAPLDQAGPDDLAFFDNVRYVDDFKATSAGVCLCAQAAVDKGPESTTLIACADPYRAFASVMARLFPTALLPSGTGTSEDSGTWTGIVHPTAIIEDGVRIDAGAVVGAGVSVGAETVIASGAVVGAGVRIGRNCAIGPGVSVSNALIGDRVILHDGVRVGQDGFGFAMGRDGHVKVPQIGRVIIQDDVEIGANSTIDRGAVRDTVIGEGTKIDNLVQIAHNVEIGRHCVIVSQTGISGSAVLGDFVVLGGKVGVIGHVKIGAGAQIAATSHVKDDVPPGVRWGGSPAKPVRQWFREVTALSRLAERGDTK